MIIDIPGAENLSRDLSKIKISILKYIKSNTVLDNPDINFVFDELFSFVDNMLLFWSLETRDSIGFDSDPRNNIISNIVKNGSFNELQDFFNECGFTDELIHSNISGIEELYIKYPNGKTVSFADASSTGMNSLLLVFYWLQNIKKNERVPSFIFIDDFDAFYHFKLSRHIVKELMSKELIKMKCQILVTTHNTSLMTTDILRPDCYYICSKDKIVNLNNATQKSIKVWHNLENLYKGGTFN